MSGRGRWSPRALLKSAVLLLGSSCGQVSDVTAHTTASSGAAGPSDAAGSSGAAGLAAVSAGAAGSSDAMGALGGTAGAAADPAAVALSTSNCAKRRVSDCQGVENLYLSANDVFDDAPELAQCSMFNSWDGCEIIQFTFDAEGCAASVVWHNPDAREHLSELRECLSAALQPARFPCLASGTLRYEESCFIR